jgi:hypothetical protein
MSAEELKRTEDFVETRMRWVWPPDGPASFTFIMDRIEASILRDGAKFIFIDPQNHIALPPADRTLRETDIILDELLALRRLAREAGAHIMLSAHFSKQLGNPQKLGLEAIAGSAHFANVADQGFVIERDKPIDGKPQTTGKLRVVKSRYVEVLGDLCELPTNLNKESCRFEETAVAEAMRAAHNPARSSAPLEMPEV